MLVQGKMAREWFSTIVQCFQGGDNRGQVCSDCLALHVFFLLRLLHDTLALSAQQFPRSSWSVTHPRAVQMHRLYRAHISHLTPPRAVQMHRLDLRTKATYRTG